MNKKTLITAGVIVLVVILALFAFSFVGEQSGGARYFRGNYFKNWYRIPRQTPPPTGGPTPVSQDLTDLETELSTFDTNFDADLQQLDTQLRGI